MTRQRNDTHSTEFGLWIREQSEISSFIGYRAYNLDYVWWLKEGYNTNPTVWTLLEEKRFMSKLRADQRLTYQWLHKKLISLNDHTYKGIHLIQFENTNPDDGNIYLDNEKINKYQLIEFLTFKDLIL